MKVMKKRLLVLLALQGCAASPYVEVGVAHQIDSLSDWFVQTDRPWQCHNPQFHGELGLEWDSKVKLAYHHQSWFGCGGPLNGRPEIFTDDIRLTKKWGGK